MDQPGLTRRKVLSGIAVAGGAGAFTGHGATALFTDEEIFVDNSVAASAQTAGVVDIEVDSTSLDGADGIVFAIDLPDGVNNNSSYIWVQAACPEPIDAAENIRVELRIDCDSNNDPYVIERGVLIDVINSLRQGVLLKCHDLDEVWCFQPGTHTEVVLEVLDSDTTASDLSFEFEFYGEQCRYHTDTSNPFEALPTCDVSDAKGISFIAFCSTVGDSLDPELVAVNNTNDDGAPTSVDWATTSDVEYVVVKYGQMFKVYDYTAESTTSDTATTRDDSDAEIYESSGKDNRLSSTPCELAADFTDDGSVDDVDEFPDDGTSVKLEWDEDTDKFVEGDE